MASRLAVGAEVVELAETAENRAAGIEKADKIAFLWALPSFLDSSAKMLMFRG